MTYIVSDGALNSTQTKLLRPKCRLDDIFLRTVEYATISVILALLLSPTVFSCVATLAWGLASLVNYWRYIKANEAKLLVQNLVTYEPISSILPLSTKYPTAIMYQVVGLL